MNAVFWIHVFSCWFMVGAIWLVQVLIYPFFKVVGEKEFSSLHQLHMKRITWIVAPAMLLEITTAAWLFVHSGGQLFFWNLFSVALLWLLTAFVNVPTHNKLNFRSEDSKDSLVRRNWPRTIMWTLRAILLLAFVVQQPSRSLCEGIVYG